MDRWRHFNLGYRSLSFFLLAFCAVVCTQSSWSDDKSELRDKIKQTQALRETMSGYDRLVLQAISGQISVIKLNLGEEVSIPLDSTENLSLDTLLASTETNIEKLLGPQLRTLLELFTYFSNGNLLLPGDKKSMEDALSLLERHLDQRKILRYLTTARSIPSILLKFARAPFWTTHLESQLQLHLDALTEAGFAKEVSVPAYSVFDPQERSEFYHLINTSTGAIPQYICLRLTDSKDDVIQEYANGAALTKRFNEIGWLKELGLLNDVYYRKSWITKEVWESNKTHLKNTRSQLGRRLFAEPHSTANLVAKSLTEALVKVAPECENLLMGS